MRIFVPGPLVPQPRQRSRIVFPKGDRKPWIRTYTSERHPVQAYKQAIRLVAQASGVEIIVGPVRLVIAFIYDRPEAMVWKRKEMLLEWKDTLPDFDNLEKSAIDALAGIAWKNDGQIAQWQGAKVIRSGGMVEGVCIEATPVQSGPSGVVPSWMIEAAT